MTSDAQQTDTQDVHDLGFQKHEHAECIQSGLKAAEVYCEKQSLRLTPVRRKVLELLLQEHRALGAYAILDRLKEAGFGSQPPVAYRALDFLTDHRLAHKIERLNAFVACTHLGEAHSPTFMICRLCDAVSEARALSAKNFLEEAAEAVGFQIERAVVEVEGICPKCGEKASV